MNNWLMHHGIKGQKWGIRLGPPYPLTGKAAKISQLCEDIKNIEYKEFDGLMTAKDVEKTMSGSCHDQVVYECARLKECGIDPNIEFFIEADDNGQGGTTHSLVYFDFNGSTWWLENAWQGQEGLHKYPNKNELFKDVFKKWDKDNDFPNLYRGGIDPNKLKAGMTLNDLIDITDFE